MKVSVLMPAHNEGKYIGRAIESILSQTYEDFEFLILNDNSTDETGNIIAKYALEDSRIKILNGNGTGVAEARNILQREAKGEFLVNADADDVCKPNRIEKLLGLALKLDHPCLVGSNFDIYKDGIFLRTETFPEGHEIIKKRLLGKFNRYVISAGQLLGTAILFKENPVKNKFKIMSDWDQFLRMQENPDVKLGNVNQSLYKYYLNSGSMTRKKFERALYSSFLRDSERRRVCGKPEFESLASYLRNYWKEPRSFIINTFLISAKYIQQFINY